jgi:ribosomal subunit interface protein
MSSFPTISMKATNLEISTGLQTLVEQKFQSLEKFIPEGETDLSCEVELEKLAGQQTGRIYRVEANLFVHGKMYRAEATEEQVEKAIDVVRNELRRELERANGKRLSLVRRGGQAIKNMLRFGK